MRKGISVLFCFLFLCTITPLISSAAQTVHKVRQGESLYSIAKKYRIPINRLKTQNKLKSTRLLPGQILIVGENKKKTIRYTLQEKNTDSKKKRLQENEPVGENDGEFIKYKTEKGDTIDRIAALFNVEKEELVEANNLRNLKSTRLLPGKTLLIPKIIDEGEEEIVDLDSEPLKPWKDGDEKYMFVKVAKSFMGAPYKYGGNTVRGLDCSAYVKKIYEIFDVQLPRSAREQFLVGSKIEKEELSVGDLVFFRTKRSAKYPTHVGIYIGDNNFIHSSSGHGKIGVKIDSLSSDYYSRVYIGATRIKSGLPEEKPEAASIPVKTSNKS